MKRSLTILLTLAIAVVLAVPAVADQAQAATDAAKGELSHANRTGEMQMYHIVLAEHGPNWKSQGSDEGMNVRMEVIDAIKKGAKNGVVVSAGLVNDKTDVEFIIILNVETKTEAWNIIHASKHVKDGFYKPVIYSYFAPKGLTVQQ